MKSQGVSFRHVAGMDYITDNKTGVEIEATLFKYNTKGVCSDCQTPLQDIKDVGEILDRNSYLCVNCVSTDKKRSVN